MKTGDIMQRDSLKRPNGYIETINKGLWGVRAMGGALSYGTGTREENIRMLKEEISSADGIVIGAGAGLSTAAGMEYSGDRFMKYFRDFAETYGIQDIYSGGFYPFPEEEIMWAWWARAIYINRYLEAPRPVYRDLRELVDGKDYFVITTNVDHQFQIAGFDKKRLFYTQGDYGLFQSTEKGDRNTYDNRGWVIEALEAQGFEKDSDGKYVFPENKTVSMRIPSELVPRDPKTGTKYKMNLRSDDTFVEDDGWKRASAAYSDFLRRHEGLRMLFLEIGVGGNTPVIIKYPFWQMVKENPGAVYACLNYSDSFCPNEIEKRSICIDGDSGEVIRKLKA